MTLFSSRRERRLWILTLLVVATIYATLGLTQPLAGFLREKGLLSMTFILAVALVAAAVLVHGFRRRPRGAEIAVILGIAAVYLLVMMRIDLVEERTHLIEYGVVGLLVFEALSERAKQGAKISPPALSAVLITGLIGLIDENIQFLLPGRVFDAIDILFNFLAGTMAILGSLALTWTRRRFGSEKD